MKINKFSQKLGDQWLAQIVELYRKNTLKQSENCKS